MLRISQAVDFSTDLLTHLGDALGTWSQISRPKECFAELLLRPNRASLDLALHYHLAEAVVEMSPRDCVTLLRHTFSPRVYVMLFRHTFSPRECATFLRHTFT